MRWLALPTRPQHAAWRATCGTPGGEQWRCPRMHADTAHPPHRRHVTTVSAGCAWSDNEIMLSFAQVGWSGRSAVWRVQQHVEGRLPAPLRTAKPSSQFCSVRITDWNSKHSTLWEFTFFLSLFFLSFFLLSGVLFDTACLLGLRGWVS
jgi:hypothetical protein